MKFFPTKSVMAALTLSLPLYIAAATDGQPLKPPCNNFGDPPNEYPVKDKDNDLGSPPDYYPVKKDDPLSCAPPGGGGSNKEFLPDPT